MGQMTTYTDDLGQLTRRDRSTTIPLPPEPLTEFQKFTSATTGMVLPIFGANLFQNVPSTFAPVDNAPVPPDYVVGPDDELRLRVWGQVNFNANLRVDRSGNVFVPQVGAVEVAGTRFSDLDQTLRKAVGKIYRNFDLTVQLGQIRAIQIYMTGEARRPGVYTVSSLSSLIDALFASGGPSVQGSMRHIELRRGATVVTTFDLYGLLVQGDKSKDAKLQSGDVIFIPPVGPQAAVLGSVRRAAIYEFLPGETVGSVVKYAGNTTSPGHRSARLARSQRGGKRAGGDGGGARHRGTRDANERRRRAARNLGCHEVPEHGYPSGQCRESGTFLMAHGNEIERADSGQGIAADPRLLVEARSAGIAVSGIPTIAGAFGIAPADESSRFAPAVNDATAPASAAGCKRPARARSECQPRPNAWAKTRGCRIKSLNSRITTGTRLKPHRLMT